MQTPMPTGSMCAEQDGSRMAASVTQSDSAWHASSPTFPEIPPPVLALLSIHGIPLPHLHACHCS